ARQPGGNAAGSPAGIARVASSVRARLRPRARRPDSAAQPHPALTREPPPPGTNRGAPRRLEELGVQLDIRLAATWGTQLGLVEVRGQAVRFPHSIMQAYLWSRLLDVAMTDAR